MRLFICNKQTESSSLFIVKIITLITKIKITPYPPKNIKHRKKYPKFYHLQIATIKILEEELPSGPGAKSSRMQGAQGLNLLVRELDPAMSELRVCMPQ